MNNILKWLKRTIIGIAGVAVLLLLVLWLFFYFWRQESIEALPGDSRVVETSMGPVEYQLQGDSEKHVLLIHGTPGSYRTFGIAPLLESGYNVVSPSRPGYFRTPLSVGATPAEQADAFRALLESLQIDSAAVVSISGGGPSALQFALRYPEMCNELILMASPTKRIEGRQQSLIQKLFSTEFGRWIQMKMMLSQVENPDLARRAEQYVQSTVFPLSEIRAGSQNDIQQLTRLPDYPLEQIEAPTLVLHGTADSRLAAHTEHAVESIPGATLLTIKGKGHFDVVFFGVDTSFTKAIEFMNDY